MDTKITFLGKPSNRIKEPRIIGASLDAVFAADALATIDDNNAVLRAFIGCARWTDINALGMTAMIT